MAAQPTPAHPVVMEAQAETQANPSITTTTTPDSPLPAPIFTTSRLLVRPLHPQDASSMSQHANNPAITKYMSLSFPNPCTLEAAHSWIGMNLTPPILNWGICERSAPGAVIGGIGLKIGAVDVQMHAAEIGYWVGEEFWGKGYVTEALEGLTEYCFTGGLDGRFSRLWGVVFEGNTGSMRCFEKCGYAKEGVLKGAAEKHGVVSNLHVFGLVKGDWERRVKSG